MNSLSDIGVAGLAVMGENLVLNMANHGFSVSVYNRTHSKVETFLKGRAKGRLIYGFPGLREFIQSLSRPRRVMMMLKAGHAVDEFIDLLLPYLEPGDILIDGGNSNYQDTARRVMYLEKRGIHCIGCGVSGGEEGALKGPSLMPGGSAAAWPSVDPLLTAIAARAADGSPCCTWMGGGSAGHFVKMVHNGIEYGDMQLICEAYHLMKDLLGLTVDDLAQVFGNWQKGRLESYLIEITGKIMSYRDETGEPLIDRILDTAGQKGTGKWTAIAALDYGVPLGLISESVYARCLSARREERLTASRLLSGPMKVRSPEREDFLIDLEKALFSARCISYAQGFSLLRAASTHHGWDLPLSAIARVWRAGCIIRSAFLNQIAEAFNREPQPENLLFDPYFLKTVTEDHLGLRRCIATAVTHGIPLPSHASALSYYDGLRNDRLPANLLQAQRDFFGAHTYERIDRPRGEFFHTNWNSLIP
jgi:6-phosphogluconate dehydrogenase